MHDKRDDGRVFAWVRRRGAAKKDDSGRDPAPAILFDPSIGGPVEIVGEPQKLSPAEYFDDLDTLARRYPAPPIMEDS